MKSFSKISLLSIIGLSLSSFDGGTSEYSQLQKFEYLALKRGIRKEYTYDFTNKEGCNKTRIKYLGIVHTNQGKQYKILTSFFVFSASSTCHGTSKIKIYNIKNKFIGDYDVGMPEGLPDTLVDNRLLYLRNSDDCNLRRERKIDLSNGLLKTFYIQCTNDSGDQYHFSSGH